MDYNGQLILCDNDRDKKLRVLVACEESQAVTIEFRKIGVEAYSCDILPCSGGQPEWHIQQDVRGVLKADWDAVIAFPPCTYLTCTGNKWFKPEFESRFPTRKQDRADAIEFFKLFTKLDCPWAIENPVGVMSSHFRKPDQTVQPWMFGDEYTKKTCLWLHELPKLIPTNIVGKGEILVAKTTGKTRPAWYYDNHAYNAETRALYRSKTFPGIARAMATQWTNYLIGETL